MSTAECQAIDKFLDSKDQNDQSNGSGNDNALHNQGTRMLSSPPADSAHPLFQPLAANKPISVPELSLVKRDTVNLNPDAAKASNPEPELFSRNSVNLNLDTLKEKRLPKERE